MRVCRDKDGCCGAQLYVSKAPDLLRKQDRFCKVACRAIAHVHSTVRITWFGAKVGKGHTHFRQINGLINLGGGNNRSMRKAAEQEAYRHQQDHCGLCECKGQSPPHASHYHFARRWQTQKPVAHRLLDALQLRLCCCSKSNADSIPFLTCLRCGLLKNSMESNTSRRVYRPSGICSGKGAKANASAGVFMSSA